jgi:hypothetical protein
LWSKSGIITIFLIRLLLDLNLFHIALKFLHFCFTEELIGIEYLYNQTGKPLGAKNPVSEVEPDDSLLDEGFEDSAAMDDNDPTIHIVDSFLPALSRERAQQIMQQNRPSQSGIEGE